MDNYEEKYKKALAWMQSLYKGLHGKTKEEAEEAFPELKDEDREEKEMLDWIISYLESRALNTYIVQERENLNKAVIWLRNQSEISVGNDLQSEIDILNKRYPEISFAKLSRIAIHIANWQKQQDKQPINDDLEEASKNHAVERYRTTRDRELAEKCKWSFKAGAQWKEKKDKQH